MLSREDIETFKTNYIKSRDRFIANVNVMQGAIDGMDALLAVWDQKEKAVKGAEEGFEGTEIKELLDGRSEG